MASHKIIMYAVDTRKQFVRWLQTICFLELHHVGTDYTSDWTHWNGVILCDVNPEILEKVIRPALPAGAKLEKDTIVFDCRQHDMDAWWEEVKE
jgi:hypothetical protein